jgi:decaprenylphospho-beta-D-ribofuranose 2-oxidase
MSAKSWKQETLTGWGRTSHSRSDVAFPSDAEELQLAVAASADRSLIARGAGRSYGDVALNEHGSIVCCSRMQRICSFDPVSGEVVAEAGVTFGDLLDAFLGQGWIPPVTPGTQFATLGGAVANDIHGKNHDADGSLCDHVKWIDLVLPDGTLTRASATQNPDLFRATCGGIGLTGIICRICIQMARTSGEGVVLREQRARNLEEYFELLETARTSCRYSVGWIDAVAAGRAMGRGVLETASHAEGHIATPPRRALRIPPIIPNGVVNRYTVRAFNELYFRRVPARGRQRTVDFRRFFYPLDALIDWNNLYGNRGFMQFQCVIPDVAAQAGVTTILSRIVKSGNASFLAVIKTMGSAGSGFLSFPMPGLTLALDFPVRPGLQSLLDSLHDILLEHGGRVYLAKDAALRPAQFLRMYPLAGRLQAVRSRVDPRHRMGSDMTRRLGL